MVARMTRPLHLTDCVFLPEKTLATFCGTPVTASANARSRNLADVLHPLVYLGNVVSIAFDRHGVRTGAKDGFRDGARAAERVQEGHPWADQKVTQPSQDVLKLHRWCNHPVKIRAFRGGRSARISQPCEWSRCRLLSGRVLAAPLPVDSQDRTPVDALAVDAPLMVFEKNVSRHSAVVAWH